MVAYLLTVASAVAAVGAAAVLLIGEFLTRPRLRRIPPAAAARPAPKHRSDFTLTA